MISGSHIRAVEHIVRVISLYISEKENGLLTLYILL